MPQSWNHVVQFFFLICDKAAHSVVVSTNHCFGTDRVMLFKAIDKILNDLDKDREESA